MMTMIILLFVKLSMCIWLLGQISLCGCTSWHLWYIQCTAYCL